MTKAQVIIKHRYCSTHRHLPVCAHAMRSRLARTTGMEYFCTGVGLPYLHKATLFSMISPNSTSENYTNSTTHISIILAQIPNNVTIKSTHYIYLG